MTYLVITAAIIAVLYIILLIMYSKVFVNKDKYADYMTMPPQKKQYARYAEAVKSEYFEAAAKKAGVNPQISSFHAGAETHVYANRTNSKGEKFLPYLVGLADVHNMHSKEENVDYKSIIKGQELLNQFYEAYIG